VTLVIQTGTGIVILPSRSSASAGRWAFRMGTPVQLIALELHQQVLRTPGKGLIPVKSPVLNKNIDSNKGARRLRPASPGAPGELEQVELARRVDGGSQCLLVLPAVGVCTPRLVFD
jgi:hypothetical protein